MILSDNTSNAVTWSVQHRVDREEDRWTVMRFRLASGREITDFPDKETAEKKMKDSMLSDDDRRDFRVVKATIATRIVLETV